MSRRSLLRHREWGESILARLDDTYVPTELATHVRAFRRAQKVLTGMTKRASSARERRDSALAALGRADAAHERALSALAKRLAAAGAGTTRRPFGETSDFTVVQILTLGPAEAAAETTRIASRLRGRKAAGAIKKAAAACTDAARALAVASGRVTAAQAAYARALDVRDEGLVAWSLAFSRLRRVAERVWRDAPTTLARVFAPHGQDDAMTVLELRPVLPNVMNGVHTS